MEIKRISCPKCGVVLDVRNSKNEEAKLITCPKCGSQLRVKFHHASPQQPPLDAHTVLASGFQSVGATQLVMPNMHGGQTKNIEQKAYISWQGQEYLLQIGQNIIGRKASSSTATVQIATDDMYVSRQHAVINIIKQNNVQLKATLSNYKNKNATQVNGQTIENGDEIVLHNGDKIMLADTEIIYNQQ